MAKQAPIGARGEAEETVDLQHTLTAHHPQLPPVYSTPDMIRLMETAAFHALQPYYEGDEITVGTAINVEHRVASGIALTSAPRQYSNPLTGDSTSCESPPMMICRKSVAVR